jgi:hypothetical protein
MRRFCVELIPFVVLGCSGPASGDKNGHVSAGGSNASAGAGGSSSGGSTSELAGGTGASAGSSTAGGSGGTDSAGGSGGTNTGGTGASGSTPESCSDPVPSDPAPSSEWANSTGNLAGMASACANLAWIVAVPCSRTVIATVVQKGLWATEDGGTTWTALAGALGNTTTSVVFDQADPSVFWETGIHVGSGLFHTTDAGNTFSHLGEGLVMNSQLVGVDFTDPDRQTLLVGTHGGKQQLYLSTDGGANFDNIGLSFGAEVTYTEAPLVIDSHTFLLGLQDCGAGSCGILRTTDSGVTWDKKADFGVSHYGAPLWAKDGSIYWPLGAEGGMVKSTDLGETWTQIVQANIITSTTPVELPDGSVMTIGTDYVVRTTDGGATWDPVGETLPIELPSGGAGNIAYSARTKTIFLSNRDCGNVVLSNAVMSAGFDYEN